MIIKSAASQASWKRFMTVLESAKKGSKAELARETANSLRPSQQRTLMLGALAALGGKEERGLNAIKKSGFLDAMNKIEPRTGTRFENLGRRMIRDKNKIKGM